METFLISFIVTASIFTLYLAIFERREDDDDDHGGGMLQPVYVPTR